MNPINRSVRQLVNWLLLENGLTTCMVSFAGLVLVVAFLRSSFEVHEALTVLIAALTALVAMITFISNHRTTTIRHYAQEEQAILGLERDSAKLLASVRENGYETLPLGGEEFYAYEVIAHKSLKVCSEIFSEQLWRETIRLHFVPAFERVRRLHWDWFNDNKSLFDHHFVAFFRDARWRNDLADDHADQLRWIYEVDLYDKLVLSPLNENLRDDLFGRIESVLSKFAVQDRSLHVADFGCGNGKLLLWLTRHSKIRQILGGDYSASMILAAKRVVQELDEAQRKKVTLGHLDMRDLSDLAGRFDVAFSINSILPRDPTQMPRMLTQVCETVRQGGLFIGVLPSFDTVLQLKELDTKYETEELVAKGAVLAGLRAKWRVWRRYKKSRLNVKKALYADDGVNPQRFFKDVEIATLFSARGFVVEEQQHFSYPWEICKEFGWGHHPNHPPCVYDIFVVARRQRIQE